MAWKHNDPDPLEERRRQLAEQERLLDEQRRRLRHQLENPNDPSSDAPAEPPVWRREEDGPSERAVDPTPARKRTLARQRQRDMAFAFVLIVLLLIILGIVLWIAYAHNTAPVNGT